ncbi:MAG: MBL fold metallo-hydrolase [Proteobacteria bacterium]|nr:MBL fold metallo-hydrolase [Pseudomonadota bacterium]
MGQIAAGVHFIPGQDEFIPDSHAYVLGELSSDDLTLIDPGLMGKGSYKIQAIRGMGVELESIKRVIMTHTHLDHIGCLADVLHQMPWAEVWMHTLEAESLETGDERTVYGMDMFREMCQAQYALKPGAFKFHVNRKLQDGNSLNVGGTVWEVIHVPGHSPGSVALYNDPKKILIPGDVIYADHAIGRFDLHGASGPELQESLFRLAELKIEVLLPGHNRMVGDLPPGYVRETARQWEPYLV